MSALHYNVHTAETPTLRLCFILH